MKPRIKEAIVVEGRYDKNALLQTVDALVLETAGFGLFKDGELRELLRRLAGERGLVILTDGDGAGFLIRNHLKSVLPAQGVLHAYIPDVPGKERRKRAPSAEGKLGVEGMPPETLLLALRRAGATFLDAPPLSPQPAKAPITKADLYAWGLAGGPGSAQRRQALMRRLDLPARMSANTLVEVLNALYTKEELESEMDTLS